MRSAVFVSLAALAVAQLDSESSSISIPPYSNPNTQYLTQTDSRGVVTGQPTTFPVLVTDLPEAATSPAGSNFVPTATGLARSTDTDSASGPTGTPGSGAGGRFRSAASSASASLRSATSGLGSRPTPSSGSDSESTPGSGSGSGSPTSSSGGASESTGAAAAGPSFQVGTGLLGLVGAVFAAFL